MKEIIDEAYDHALEEASFEAFEGKLTTAELNKKVDSTIIKMKAIDLLKP